MTRLKEDVVQIRFALIPVIIYLVFMQIFFGTVCPFKAFFKIDCPGCGLTHSIYYLLQGNIKLSLYYNWTGILWFILIVLFGVDRYVKKLKISPFPTLVVIVSFVTIIRYIITI